MKPDETASRAARELGERSAKARKKKWGEEEFRRRMIEYGRLGGRPKKPLESAERREE